MSFPYKTRPQKLTKKPAWSILTATLALLVAAVLTTRAQAQLVVFQMSDQHSDYRRMAEALRTMEIVRAEKLALHPTAKFLLIVNGDFAGSGRFSRTFKDEGMIGIDALVELQKSGRYEVVFVPGNHEGFDWGGARGNAIFLRQLQRLYEGGVRILGANITPHRSAQHFFRDFSDVMIPGPSSPARLRLIGLTLQRFSAKSSYDPSQLPLTIQRVSSSATALRQQLKLAHADGVNFTAVAAHEAYRDLYDIVDAVLTKISPNGPRLLFAAAGHNHEILSGTLRNTLLFESGHGFDFSVTQIESDGSIQNPVFFDQARQLATLQRAASVPPAIERLIAERVEQRIAEEYRGDTVLAQVPAIDFGKANFTAGRHRGGDSVSAALVQWVRSEAARLENLEWASLPTFGIWNSSSWRRDAVIAAGNLTEEMVESIYPMEKPVKAFRLTGREAETIILGVFVFRRDSEKDPREKYSPQLSPNIANVDGEIVRVFHEGVWVRLRDLPDVILAVDPFIAINGHKLAEIEKIYKKKPAILAKDAVATLREHLLPLLTTYCEEAMSPDLRARAQ